MIQIKFDPFKTLMQNVSDNIDEGDAILFEFQIVPLDYRVKDRTTPTLFITSEKLLFAYDDLIEVFELRQLEMDILGETPKFTPWQLWFEGKYRYTEVDGNSFEQLKNSTYYPRLAFNEKNQVPKEFALRSAGLVANSYQSWAMAQIVINVKNGVPNDQRLLDLFKGDFAKYNGKTLLLFIAVFVVYTVVKSLFNQYGTVFGTVLDVLFGGFSAFILWWLYKSIEKNLLSYKAVYDGYQVGDLNVGRITNRNAEVRSASAVLGERETAAIANSSPSATSTTASNDEDLENELVDAITQLSEINAFDDGDGEVTEPNNTDLPLQPQAQTNTSAPVQQQIARPVLPAQRPSEQYSTVQTPQMTLQPQALIQQQSTPQVQTGAPVTTQVQQRSPQQSAIREGAPQSAVIQQSVQLQPAPQAAPAQSFPPRGIFQPAQTPLPVPNQQQKQTPLPVQDQHPTLVGKPIQPPMVGAYRDTKTNQ